jgi:hypothetical protein
VRVKTQRAFQTSALVDDRRTMTIMVKGLPVT